MTEEITEAAPATPSEPDSVVDATESAESRKRRRIRWAVEWMIIILVAATLALGMRTYVFQTFFIPSSSMEPTLNIGDRIIVSKLSVELGTVHVGDILVFARPPREHCQPPAVPDLVKRVIAVGPTWIVSHGNKIYVNPHPGKDRWTLVKQPWTHVEPLSYGNEEPIVKQFVPKNNYFMMGDNEPISCDSRYWGPLPAKYVVGKVFFRIWPPSRIGFL